MPRKQEIDPQLQPQLSIFEEKPSEIETFKKTGDDDFVQMVLPSPDSQLIMPKIGIDETVTQDNSSQQVDSEVDAEEAIFQRNLNIYPYDRDN
jgi:hypothetical protein